MNNIKNFKEYNEGLVSWIKGLLTGEKTDDDKIAKKLLKSANRIDFSEGGGLYPRPIVFDYEGYSFSLSYGICEFYGNEIPYNNMVKIESHFLKKLYRIALDKIREKEEEREKRKKEERERKELEKRIKLEKETVDFVERNGGIEKITHDILYQNINLNKSIYRNVPLTIFDKSSGISYSKEDNYIFISIDTSAYKGPGVTSIKYHFGKFLLDINYSYPAYNDYKNYRIVLNKEHEWNNFFISLKEDFIKFNKKDNPKKSVLKRLNL